MSPPHEISILQGPVSQLDSLVKNLPSSNKTGPLYQKESEVNQSLAIGHTITLLPNLNKKFLVSFQQQLLQPGAPSSKHPAQGPQPSVPAHQVEKERRALKKQQALLNSFERLSKHMKERNYPKQSLGFSTAKIRGFPEYDSFMGQFFNDEEPSESKNEYSVSDTRFFEALQRENPWMKQPSDTKLMRKTQKLMQYSNLSVSARLKTKCILKRSTCPFEVVKNAIPIHVQ